MGHVNLKSKPVTRPPIGHNCQEKLVGSCYAVIVNNHRISLGKKPELVFFGTKTIVSWSDLCPPAAERVSFEFQIHPMRVSHWGSTVFLATRRKNGFRATDFCQTIIEATLLIAKSNPVTWRLIEPVPQAWWDMRPGNSWFYMYSVLRCGVLVIPPALQRCHDLPGEYRDTIKKTRHECNKAKI